MMLYPTNSADRRQQPCTTTIRSRRAHPRHVLDTAALNAYVPNNVGSKSHNELTWNHVVSVFTFFGLLMTALVSLCCWSHFQFIVERRRLPANTEFNSQHRRLAPGAKVEVKGNFDEIVKGKYTEQKPNDVPQWFTDRGQKFTKYFKGGTTYTIGTTVQEKAVMRPSITWTPQSSCPNCIKDAKYDEYNGEAVKVRRTECDNCSKSGKLYSKPITVAQNEDGWKTMTGGRSHYEKDNCIIFFCAIQNKWHMCGPDRCSDIKCHALVTDADKKCSKCGNNGEGWKHGIYYRVNGEEKSLPEAGWYSVGKMHGVDEKSDKECSIRVVPV